MPRESATSRVVSIFLLVCGALVFSFPFVWLVATSLKVERELFRGELDIRPEQPNARLQSPYFDPRQFSETEVVEPQWTALRPLLQEGIRRAEITFPAANSAELEEIAAAGLFKQMQARTPASIWNSNAEPLRRFVEQDLTPQRIRETMQLAHRQLALGSIVVRDDRLHTAEIAPVLSPSGRWMNNNPELAQLLDGNESTISFAAVAYDFSSGERFTLVQFADLPFPADRMQRIQMRLRPDDTWHAMTLSIEAAGVRYVAERPNDLQDFRWLTATWQKPSDDDNSTKIKTWLVIRPQEHGPQFEHGSSKIKIVLEFRKRTPMQASFAKSLYNFQRVLDQIPFWRYVRVSVLLVVLNIILTLFSSSLVAYAFARLQWPGRDIAFLVMLGTMMIPGQVTMIPHFLIWKTVGAYNTLVPLWAGAAFGNAFFIFLMRQFLKGVPADLEDAARIDGCGFLRIYWHVMLPLVKPSLAAIAIFTFIGSWNDFLGPLIYVADQRLYPLAFGLFALSVQLGNNPVLTMAASLLMTLPVIAVFFLTQRYFVQGITLTGMKG